MKAKSKKILQFRIELDGIKPAIWRRVLVRHDTNLRTFALALLLATGWKNSHLHEFIIDDKHYGIMDESAQDMLAEMPMEDETEYEIRDFSEKKLKKFVFLYDFGDGWEHDVVFERAYAAESNVFYPNCIEGARNCPPEDCGGTGGYYELAEKLKNPDDDEYERLLGWLGGRYDTEFFNTDVINSTIKKIDAYERFGFEGDESAWNDISGDELVNCGIGPAPDEKNRKNIRPESAGKLKAPKKTKAKKKASDPFAVWNNMSKEHKKIIVDSIYCGKCADITTVKDCIIYPAGKSLVISGKCLKCGNKVARVLEGE